MRNMKEREGVKEKKEDRKERRQKWQYQVSLILSVGKKFNRGREMEKKGEQDMR